MPYGNTYFLIVSST
jgi:hypothetical protein